MTHLSGTDVRRVSKEYGVPNGHGFNSAVLTISPNISATFSFQKLSRILMSIDKRLAIVMHWARTDFRREGLSRKMG